MWEKGREGKITVLQEISQVVSLKQATAIYRKKNIVKSVSQRIKLTSFINSYMKILVHFIYYIKKTRHKKEV